MNIEKSCRNCTDNDSCCLYDKIDFDLGSEVECKLEEGVIDDILKEHLELAPMLEGLQEDGIIKKNVKIKDINMDTYMVILIEQISEGIWNHVINKVADMDIKQGKMIDSEFYCSEWR